MPSDSEVMIIDPPPAGTTTSQETAPPAMASPRTQRTPAAASPRPQRAKRKTRALSMSSDDDDAPAAPPKAAAKRPAKKRATVAPAKERRAPVFLEEPPANAPVIVSTGNPPPAPTSSRVSPKPRGSCAHEETDSDAAARRLARVFRDAEGVNRQTRANVDKMRSELSSVRNDVSEVRQLLAQLVALQQPTESTPRRTEEAETHSTATSALEPAPVPSVRTQPNAKGELPPEPVRNLSSDMFAFEGKKVKGNYYPPQVHSLAAHKMFKDLDLLSGHEQKLRVITRPVDTRWGSLLASFETIRDAEAILFFVVSSRDFLNVRNKKQKRMHQKIQTFIQAADIVACLEKGARIIGSVTKGIRFFEANATPISDVFKYFLDLPSSIEDA
ncbi:hypothetical protein ATCC90586_010828 [Pythium insidiosum]|nr:hypothetical protein ATCC90586_010828 [Pythium insidiosum]